jgi:hypothetical protein
MAPNSNEGGRDVLGRNILDRRSQVDVVVANKEGAADDFSAYLKAHTALLRLSNAECNTTHVEAARLARAGNG